jgi:hypothetical protein
MEINQNQMNQNPINAPIICKHCGSNAVVKFGHFEGNQRYWCKACERKFISNDHLFKMKTPFIQVSSALDDYFEGDSINEIRDHLSSRNNTPPPSSKTVYGWITKYTDEAIKQFKDCHPQCGEVLSRVLCEIAFD